MACKPLFLVKWTMPIFPSCFNLLPEPAAHQLPLAGPPLSLPLNYKTPAASKSKDSILFQTQKHTHIASSHFPKTHKSKTKQKAVYPLSNPSFLSDLWPIMKTVVFTVSMLSSEEKMGRLLSRGKWTRENTGLSRPRAWALGLGYWQMLNRQGNDESSKCPHPQKVYLWREDGLSEQTHVTGVFWIVEICMVERRRKELNGEGSIVKRKNN